MHKGIPKQHAKFGPNRISNSGDIDFYRKIGLVWFALVWFSFFCFLSKNVKNYLFCSGGGGETGDGINVMEGLTK